MIKGNLTYYSPSGLKRYDTYTPRWAWALEKVAGQLHYWACRLAQRYRRVVDPDTGFDVKREDFDGC